MTGYHALIWHFANYINFNIRRKHTLIPNIEGGGAYELLPILTIYKLAS